MVREERFFLTQKNHTHQISVSQLNCLGVGYSKLNQFSLFCYHWDDDIKKGENKHLAFLKGDTMWFKNTGITF